MLAGPFFACMQMGLQSSSVPQAIVLHPQSLQDSCQHATLLYLTCGVALCTCLKGQRAKDNINLQDQFSGSIFSFSAAMVHQN